MVNKTENLCLLWLVTGTVRRSQVRGSKVIVPGGDGAASGRVIREGAR